MLRRLPIRARLALAFAAIAALILGLAAVLLYLRLSATVDDSAEQGVLEPLLVALAVGAPAVLLLTTGLAYLLARAALAPVERLRAEADLVSSDEPGRRLPLPAARDEIARLAGTLNAMLDRLEAAVARERRLVADASHELRTPVAVLRAELEHALAGRRAPSDLEAALRSALEEAVRLGALADDLLRVAGDGPPSCEQADLAALAREAAARHATRVAAAGRTIETTPCPSTLAHVDRLAIERALDNLVDNALAHGSGTIRIGVERTGSVARVHVRDEGHGLAEAEREHAFEPFWRAPSARGRPGAGLGLASVRATARAHGGRAGLDAVPGGGADAWLELPA